MQTSDHQKGTIATPKGRRGGGKGVDAKHVVREQQLIILKSTVGGKGTIEEEGRGHYHTRAWNPFQRALMSEGSAQNAFYPTLPHIVPTYGHYPLFAWRM